MSPIAAESVPNLRRYLWVCVLQLVLTGVAVLASRLDGRLAVAAVMLVATVNASLVAVVLMGVGRDGRLVSMLAVMTVLFMVGLLVWPAWDVAQRTRWF